MSLISVSNLTFCYDGSYDNVFENVSFQLDSQWRLGFIGRNGRGKTTLLKLLMGQYEYEGTIAAKVDFEYFPYEVKDKTPITYSILEEVNPDLEDWRLFKELDRLEVDPEVLYRPFETLSHGQQTKVLLAVLFTKDNNFLLIDEPTNHLDVQARELVARYLNGKSGFILVSHDRNFLDSCINHIISINKADIEIHKGNFSSWYENKTARDNLELAQNQTLKGDIKRLKEAARRTSDWSDKVEKTKRGSKNSGLKPDTGYIGHKAAKMMARSKSIEKRQLDAIEEKSQLLKNIETAEDLKLTSPRYHSQKFAALDGVSVFYGDKEACHNVNFELCRGDRICITGKNGCGKSSILKLIAGDDITYTGNLAVASNLIISKVEQDTAGLQGNLSLFADSCGIDESLFKAILRKLDFERVQFEKDMADFSGGQKKKVLIARSLCQQAHLYVWDEPLNFVDIFSRMQIERLLMEYRPTLLFVEHDRAFVDKIATKIVSL